MCPYVKNIIIIACVSCIWQLGADVVIGEIGYEQMLLLVEVVIYQWGKLIFVGLKHF